MPSTLVRLGLRLSIRGALAWTGAMVVLPLVTVSAWSSAYPTQESREVLGSALGSNPAFRAFGGTPRALDTAGGFMSWRIGSLSLVILSIWALLTATRLLRGEEEAGRRELVLSAPVRARGLTMATFAVLAIDLLCIGAGFAAVLLAVGPRYGLAAGGTLLFAAGLTLGAGAFAAIGAVASELMPTRRGAAGLAGFVLGAAQIARMIADGSQTAPWLRWASPLGWFSELHVYAGGRPLVLLAWAGTILGLGSLAVWLSGRRDLGSAVLHGRERARPHVRWLRRPETAALRFVRSGALAWTAGLSAFSLLVGVISSSIPTIIGSSGIGDFITPLADIASVRGYLAFGEFLLLAIAISFVAAGSIGSHGEEERTGRADTALSGAITRSRWLGSRVLATVATATIVALTASLACALGVSISGGDVPVRPLVAGGLAVLPVASVFLGLGLAAHGVVPRAASQIAYGMVAASFLLQVVGSIARWPGWLLGLSPFHHLGAAPLLPVNIRSSFVLLAVGAAGALVGHAAFARRDLLSS